MRQKENLVVVSGVKEQIIMRGLWRLEDDVFLVECRTAV